MAAMILWEACNRQGRSIYVISDSEKNLSSALFKELRDVINASPELRNCLHQYKGHIEVPATGSIIVAAPNTFGAAQGKNRPASSH